MFQFIFWTVAIVVGFLVGPAYAVRSNALLNFLDQHPNASWVPWTEYYVAEGLSGIKRYPRARVYYERIIDKYPESVYYEQAYFANIEAADASGQAKGKTIEAYKKYLELFPDGVYRETAKRRILLNP